MARMGYADVTTETGGRDAADLRLEARVASTCEWKERALVRQRECSRHGEEPL